VEQGEKLNRVPLHSITTPSSGIKHLGGGGGTAQAEIFIFMWGVACTI
jgi:hypothetical protein